MSETLHFYPVCGRSGYTRSGLKAHRCRGADGRGERRRLTEAEIADAQAYESGALAAALDERARRSAPGGVA